MNWQIKYALANVNDVNDQLSAELVRTELLKFSATKQPDAFAAISAAKRISSDLAQQYHHEYPELDFLCGYRTECVWEGSAISYLEDNKIGWGSFGTLTSAVLKGNTNQATHKTYFFSDRLIKQYGGVRSVTREFDRVYQIDLHDGRTFRMGMLADYEPTADAVRSLWSEFGPIDVIWNINPNGSPTDKSVEASKELGCEIFKWEGLKRHIHQK